MDTLKFNTFANSPTSHTGYPSKMVTQHSFGPGQMYSNIPQLKKEMQDAINSKKQSRKTKKHYQKYPSNISLAKSDISLLSAPEININLPLSVLQLEVNVTEDILALREDKITLMQEFNKIIQKKYKIQRDIAALKKTNSRHSSEIKDLSVFDNSSGKKKERNQVEIKNQSLRQEHDFLVRQNMSQSEEFSSEKQDELIIQIELLQENQRIIKQKIAKIDQNVRPEQQRFQTFSPGKQSKSKQSPSMSSPISSSQSDQKRLTKLRQIRNSIYKQISDRAPSSSQRSYFYELIEQNQQLNQKIDRITNTSIGVEGSSKMSLQFLREKIKEEEQAKQYFFDDLNIFKKEANGFRVSNDEMKKQLRIS